MPVSKIISGGQTGADRAALDAARAAGVAIGGWVPHGRWAEDGRVPDEFHEMRETRGDDPAERTVCNVMAADGTLLVSHGPLQGGSALTQATAQRSGKPCSWIDLDAEPAASALARIQAWLAEHRIQVLNVAGPRASEDPTIYEAAFALVSALLARSR
jgi:hypothetical protein